MLILLVLVFMVFLLCGIPIAYSMGITAVLYIIQDPVVSGMVLAQKVYTAIDSFSLMAIPFFMFAGDLMNVCGITERLVGFSSSIVGHIRGGLAHTSIVAGAFMAGISGSGNADATAIGGMMLPMFEKEGYEEGFAVSVVAAAAALGPIIPPSIIMVIYANTANLPIGRMFLSGIVPGILIAISYMVYVYFYSKKNGLKGKARASLREVAHATYSALGALVMPLIIIGGIMFGIFTATESGVVASIYAIGYGIYNKRLTLEAVKKALVSSMMGTAVPVFIIGMASIFSYILTIENMPSLLVNGLLSISDNRYVVLMLIVAIVTLMGMFIDGTAIVVMLVPILTSMTQHFGYDSIYFALIVCLTVIIGGLTPPVGITFYIVSSIRNTPLNKVVPQVWKFAVCALIVVLLAIFVPEIIVSIPNYFMGPFNR